MNGEVAVTMHKNIHTYSTGYWSTLKTGTSCRHIRHSDLCAQEGMKTDSLKMRYNCHGGA